MDSRGVTAGFWSSPGPTAWEPEELTLPTRWRVSVGGGADLCPAPSIAVSIVRVRGRIGVLEVLRRPGTGGGLDSPLS
jgi:hypothetical protein